MRFARLSAGPLGGTGHMFAGNKTEVIGLWIVATGLVLALIGGIGTRSSAVTSIIGNSRYTSIALVAIGVALSLRGFFIYHRARTARRTAFDVPPN